jgi:hypothetical protein
MPSPQGGATIAGVPDRRHLLLEVEPDADPPVGSLSDEQGTSIGFTGWLGLASALNRVLHPRRPGARSAHDMSTTDGDRRIRGDR